MKKTLNTNEKAAIQTSVANGLDWIVQHRAEVKAALENLLDQFNSYSMFGDVLVEIGGMKLEYARYKY
jgi:hypothetical protein